MPDGTLFGEVKIEIDENGKKIKRYVPFKGDKLLTEIKWRGERWKININYTAVKNFFPDGTVKIEVYLTNQKGEIKVVDIVWPPWWWSKGNKRILKTNQKTMTNQSGCQQLKKEIDELKELVEEARR